MLFRRGRRRGRPECARHPVEEIIGVEFRDGELLRRAFTHRSYAHENSLPPEQTYERLEFLGDAVLDVVISEYLYRRHAELGEGDLTRIRSYLVNMNSLADTARSLGLGEHIHLSRDEKADGGEDKSSILADVLEALIGAVYLDRGLEETERVCLRIFGDKLDKALSDRMDYDYKSQLQELLVKERGALPRYRLREEGPDHRKVFHAVVFVENRRLGQGSGSSKKEAEQEAARDALRKMGRC